MLGADAAAPADELSAVIGPRDCFLEVLAGGEPVEDPLRRRPAAGFGVDPDGPGEPGRDDLDRFRDDVGL